MKSVAWALGVLFAVWLTAFFGIKIYDLGCIASPSICFAETGIWLRKLVLLEWASKWQTLLAGVSAIIAGAFVIVAGREQILFQRTEMRRERISGAVDTFIAVGSLYSTYLNRLKNDLIVPLPVQAPPVEMMRDIAFICPNMIMYVLSLSELSNLYHREYGASQQPPIVRRNRVLLNATMLFEMFNQIAIHATTHQNFKPRIDTTQFGFDKSFVIDQCRELGLPIEDYGSYATLFKISVEDITSPPAHPRP